MTCARIVYTGLGMRHAQRRVQLIIIAAMGGNALQRLKFFITSGFQPGRKGKLLS